MRFWRGLIAILSIGALGPALLVPVSVWHRHAHGGAPHCSAVGSAAGDRSRACEHRDHDGEHESETPLPASQRPADCAICAAAALVPADLAVDAPLLRLEPTCERDEVGRSADCRRIAFAGSPRGPPVLPA